jgi:hypothetical protein
MGVVMSEDQFAMVSGWMDNGNINEFVKKNPGADRLVLVGFSFAISLLQVD